jgi:hypothetical protein
MFIPNPLRCRGRRPTSAEIFSVVVSGGEIFSVVGGAAEIFLVTNLQVIHALSLQYGY